MCMCVCVCFIMTQSPQCCVITVVCVPDSNVSMSFLGFATAKRDFFKILDPGEVDQVQAQFLVKAGLFTRVVRPKVKPK